MHSSEPIGGHFSPVAAYFFPPEGRCFHNLNLTLSLKLLGPNLRVEGLKCSSKFSFHVESILIETASQKLLKTQISSELGEDVTSSLRVAFASHQMSCLPQAWHHVAMPEQSANCPCWRQSDSALTHLRPDKSNSDWKMHTECYNQLWRN